MSAITKIQEFPQPDAQAQLYINPKVLLSFYLVIPFAFLFIAIDQFAFNHQLLATYDVNFDKVFWFTVFFIHPHVLVSFFGFFEKDYWRHYKTHFAIAIPTMLALTIFGPFALGAQNYLALGGILTAKHVIAQQLGITSIVTRNRTRLNSAWEWIGILLGIIIYACVVPDEFFFLEKEVARILFLVLLGPFAFLSYKLSALSATVEGRIYVWCNFFLLASSFLFFTWKYPLLGYLIMRVVHDFTGSYFYGVHDSNRFHEKADNILYRSLRFVRLPIFWQCQLVAILIALPFNFDPNSEWQAMLFAFPTWCHYYFDSIAWKRGGPHRFYVPLRS